MRIVSAPEAAVDVRVGVHRLRDGIDQLDDELGHGVTGRSLASENESAWRDFEIRVLLEPVVQRDDVQGVEVLALVLVNTLDLDIEHPIRVQFDARRRLDVVGQPSLVPPLHSTPTLLESGVIGQRFQPSQSLQVDHPVAADGVVEQRA